jgi:hypothetical protein
MLKILILTFIGPSKSSGKRLILKDKTSVGIGLDQPKKTTPKRKRISQLLSLVAKPSLQHVLRSGHLVDLRANYGPSTNPDVRFFAVIRFIYAYAM